MECCFWTPFYLTSTAKDSICVSPRHCMRTTDVWRTAHTSQKASNPIWYPASNLYSPKTGHVKNQVDIFCLILNLRGSFLLNCQLIDRYTMWLWVSISDGFYVEITPQRLRGWTEYQECTNIYAYCGGWKEPRDGRFSLIDWLVGWCLFSALEEKEEIKCGLRNNVFASQDAFGQSCLARQQMCGNWGIS